MSLTPGCYLCCCVERGGGMASDPVSESVVHMLELAGKVWGSVLGGGLASYSTRQSHAKFYI